jgi:hypothetical protein
LAYLARPRPCRGLDEADRLRVDGAGDMSDMLSDFEKVRAIWPACIDILRAALDEMQIEMERAINQDTAFDLMTLAMLREVFWRQTVLICAGRADDDDLLRWIKTAYEDWDDEFAQ